MNLRTLAGTLLLALATVPSQAQQLKGDVRFFNGFPPGGTSDLLGRMLADALAPIVGQKVIVENRTGASGFIAAEATARSAPDGHTIFLAPMALMTISPQMPGQKVTIDVEKDLAPVTNVGGIYNVLVANPNGPFKTVPELVAYAKKNPGRLTYASAGNGTSQHLSAELFKKLTGTFITHIPYRGGAPAVIDIVAGRTDMMFGNMPEFLGQIRGGGLKPIAFGAPKASPVLPEVPLVSATVPEFKITNWFGVVTTGGTPPEWVSFWNKSIATVAKQPAFIQRMTENGMDILVGSPNDFRATIAADRKRWGEVIKSAGIRAD